MKVSISPTLIFRTPRFPYSAALIDCWPELKAAIALSSSAFYEIIKDVDAHELQALPPKVYFSVWKYFNRAKFRATPYGTFASFSILNQAIKSSHVPIVINQEQKLTIFPDWPLKNDIHFNFAQLIEKNCLLFSNSSYYLTPSSIRYIACSNSLFELSEIDQDEFVLQVLKLCLRPIRVNALVQQLHINEEGLANLYTLLEDMHDLQLIFSNYDPNIIGEDYFSRLGIQPEPDTAKYIIAERHVQSGGIDAQKLKAIPDLISFLQNILPVGEREAISQFINKFKKKFEDKEVSLLLALDPEMGVGYDELEQAGTTDEFIFKIAGKKREDKSRTDIKSVLSQKLSAQGFEIGKPIILNKLSFTPNAKSSPLPNSTSMILSVADNLIFLEQIGGTTANALCGRFTMADKAIEAYALNTAQLEQSANPEVLFFDVAYMVEANIDNINRRKLSYNHQLSILNYDTSVEPLTLNDIYISVQGNEIILRSATLNKRIVPKMASAYNYTRSDLSVFRLLCDLQHHQVLTNLSLSLDSIFPDLNYYPRLQYHDIVLSASKWKITKAELLDAHQKMISVQDCRLHLKNRRVNSYFKTGLSDQTLCFGLENDDDLTAFLHYMQKQDQVYLEEVVLPIESSVVDENGQPYLAQFILNLNHQEKVYETKVSREIPVQIKEVFPPGKEWLYFEIYCHQQRTDQLLAEVIDPFVDKYQHDIKKWFFIRYNENGNHIRFRILLHDEQKGQQLMSALMDDLEPYLTTGLISDIQLKTYKREVARYGAALMETVESHFAFDSRYVLSLFASPLSQFDKYRLCFEVIANIEAAITFGNRQMFDVIKTMSDAFNQEHHLDAGDFKMLNAEYQLFKNTSAPSLDEIQMSFFQTFSAFFIQVLEKCQPERRMKLFSDLLHMHVNRLFNKDQRTYEMVMYYFLLKDMQRRKAMKS